MFAKVVSIMLRSLVFTCVVMSATTLPAEPNKHNTVQQHNTHFSPYETITNIINEGYRAEAHQVTTDDGYILEMHRIPFKRYAQQGDQDRPVILLMHGLYSASNINIYLGSQHSIGYNLADAGFDVWMGNARGNRNSRRHLTLNPDDDEEKRLFFDFSWEEIGLYDIAAMIDYILENTGKEKLHYIGHSQGGTVFLVLNSMKTEYNEKIASAHFLAGVGYMNYFPDEELKETAASTDFIYNLAVALGDVEMYPPNQAQARTSNITTDKSDYCFGSLEQQPFCDAIGIKKLMTFNTERENETISASAGVGGGSLKQMAHYGQNIRDTEFRRWNYGDTGNMKHYGTSDPPVYDISKITVNVTMHYTVSDHLLDERDVLDMVNDMPNAAARKVARDSFSHGDFVGALDAKELVTDYIIEAIHYTEKNNSTGDNETNPDNPQIPDSATSVALSAVLQLSLVLSLFLIVM